MRTRPAPAGTPGGVDILLIVIIVLVVLAVLALVVLPKLRANTTRKTEQRRVESRARNAEADRHEHAAQKAVEGLETDKERAERERELADEHAQRAERLEARVEERARVAEAERIAAGEQRDRAAEVDPDR